MELLRRPSVRTTVATATALACGLVPVFLFGALQGLIRADLGFAPGAVGAGITVFFVAAGLGAVPGGRVTERVGPRVAMLLGATMAGLASLGIGLLARTWWHAALLLAVAGSAIGLIDTGGARAFADVVPARRQGLAFGIKEASVPAASMVAGASVPLLGLTVGWRPTFALALLLVPVVWLVLPAEVRGGSPAATTAITRRRPRRSTLLLVAIGSATGAGAATSTATFLVDGAAQQGISPGRAGTLLALGSALSIAVRIVSGHRVDRSRRHELQLVAWMLAGGAAGLLLLALPGAAIAVGGALVVLGVGWGWTGLVFLSAVRADPSAPAAAAGIVLAGLSTGGALGPSAFGLVVEHVGYATAWTVAGIAMTVGAAATHAAFRRLSVVPPGSAGPSRRASMPSR